MSRSSKKQLPMPVLMALSVVLIVLLGFLVNSINPFTLSMVLSMLIGIVLVIAVGSLAYFHDLKRYRVDHSGPVEQDPSHD